MNRVSCSKSCHPLGAHVDPKGLIFPERYIATRVAGGWRARAYRRAAGTLTVTDPNAGEAVFRAQTSTWGSNGHGTFTLSADGTWTYAADNAQVAIQSLGEVEMLTDSFTAVTADGTTQVVTVTINGVNDTAVIAGTTTGAATEDAADTLTSSGSLTVSDVDAGAAVFLAQVQAHQRLVTAALFEDIDAELKARLGPVDTHLDAIKAATRFQLAV